MKLSKKLIALVVIGCMVAGLFSGCTSTAEGKALYDAMLKTKQMKSMEATMDFGIRFNATGLNAQEQQSFAQIQAMLNSSKMSMKLKGNMDKNQTVQKMQADVAMSTGGMTLDMAVWVDSDLTANPPVFKEIIKLPEMLTGMDPKMAGKQYMVMDYSKISNLTGQNQTMDMNKFMQAMKDFQPKADLFMQNYLAQFNPDVTMITDAGTKDITTPEGTVKAHIYQLKLDDKSVKKLVRYTVNNMANNKDAMAFVMDYIKMMQSVTPAQAGQNPVAELEKAFADFDKAKPVLLAQFNAFMDKYENVQIIGDKGIVVDFAVNEQGYVFKQSGNIDVVVDVAKLAAASGQKNAASKGIYQVGIDFDYTMYNIDKPVTIEFPAYTAQNSIDYFEYMKSTMSQLQPATPTVKTPALKVLTVKKTAVKTVNKVPYYSANDSIKKVKGTTFSLVKGTVTIKANGKVLTFVPGKNTVKLNGKVVQLKGLNSKLIGGKVYLSAETFKQLGYSVQVK